VLVPWQTVMVEQALVHSAGRVAHDAEISFQASVTKISVHYATGREASAADLQNELNERKCRREIQTRKPLSFDYKIIATGDSQNIQIEIKNALLRKLPRLDHLRTERRPSGGWQGWVSVHFNPPCHMWGLVSLLLLIEGQVKMSEWFAGADTDPSLVAQTWKVRPSPTH
jgi:hypothetical protein